MPKIDLGRAVAVEVGERGRRRAVAADAQREGRLQVGVVVDEDRAAVLAELVARLVPHLDADRVGELIVVGGEVGKLVQPARDLRRGRRRHLRRRDGGEHAVERRGQRRAEAARRR